MLQLTYTQEELDARMNAYKEFIEKERVSYKQTIDGLEIDLANANQSRMIVVELLAELRKILQAEPGESVIKVAKSIIKKDNAIFDNIRATQKATKEEVEVLEGVLSKIKEALKIAPGDSIFGAINHLRDQLAYSERDIATLNKVVASLEKERNVAAKQLIKNSDKLQSIYEALHLEKDESAVSVIRELRAKPAADSYQRELSSTSERHLQHLYHLLLVRNQRAAIIEIFDMRNAEQKLAEIKSAIKE
jgi:hypothetical protein